MLEIIISAIFIALLLAAALGGGVTGYALSRASRSARWLALIIGLLAAVASPILHALAPIVWAPLLGALTGYVAGRFTFSRQRGDHE